jgi:chorismate mutase / prephenate dehydrogenase
MQNHRAVPSGQLAFIRAQIDVLDDELLDLLRRRNSLALRAREFKAKAGMPIRDRWRENWLLANRANRGRALGLNATGTIRVFRAVLELSRQAQFEAVEEEPSPQPRKVCSTCE